MKVLNLPTYSFKLKSDGNIIYIFDKFRKKYIKLTPEEWVRQNLLYYLESERGFPASRIVLEKTLVVNNLRKRADFLVYDSLRNPLLLAECKSYDTDLTNDVFSQISSYNIRFRVEYILISNGLKHYCCRLNFKTNEIKFLTDIPEYSSIDPAI